MLETLILRMSYPPGGGWHSRMGGNLTGCFAMQMPCVSGQSCVKREMGRMKRFVLRRKKCLVPGKTPDSN